MKFWRYLPAYLFIGLSLLHAGVAFVQFKTITEQALWFFSAGMALFFCGTLNLVGLRHPNDRKVRQLIITSNLIMTIFVVVFGAFTMNRNLMNPLAWLLISTSVAALAVSLGKTKTS